MILDTTFLIDLQREKSRQSPGAATAKLDELADQSCFISFVSEGEFACGFRNEERNFSESILAVFHTLTWSPQIAWTYSRTYRQLRQNGQMIGANDLWIAATAIDHGMPVLTRNVNEFRRVPGLTVFDY